MQPDYRAIFTEMLLAQSAAIGAFADVAARCTQLAGQEYRQALVASAGKIPPKGKVGGLEHPDGGTEIAGISPPRPANFSRAIAGLPRISMMVFLSQYDNLRGRRGVVRD